MNFLLYYILFKNFELADCEIQFQDLSTLSDPPGDTTSIYLTGSEVPAILDTPNCDQDKTKSIRGKRFKASFLSGDDYDIDGVPSTVDVETFSDGQEGRFLTRITCNTLALPFLGNIVLDDNVEAFQPKANVVVLSTTNGFGILRDVELTESDGDVPAGHYRIIDYITLCLRNLMPSQDIHVVFNLCEKQGLQELSVNFAVTGANMFRIAYEHLGFLQIGDEIEVFDSASNDGTYTITNITPNSPISIDIEVSTSTFVVETSEAFIFRTAYHAFFDTMLEARTFETDVDGRDDCYTVLEKILDAFGCFICYDHDGWWIIRWDEYDKISGGVATLRTGHFNSEGVFSGYTDVPVDKFITHDGDVLYEGYMISHDSALRWFQRKAGSLKHVYRFEQPKEIPCNSSFTRGTVDDDVLPLKTYDPDCWSIFRGWGSHSTTPNSVAQIWVRFDDNDNESERYMTLTPQASSGGEFNYVRSEGIPIDIKDKFEFSFDYSADSDNSIDGEASISIAAISLHGLDGSVWILGDGLSTTQEPEWKISDANHDTNADYYKWFFSATSGDEDYRDWKSYSIDAPPAPVAGNLYIHFFAANQSGSGIDDFVIRYNNVQFNYIPYINGTYGSIESQEHKVTGDDDSRKTIEKEMFISDSPKALFKGALKKFDGTNYLLTETWKYYNDVTVIPDSKLAKHIVFQWWNQFRKTRTVIETDLQGLNSTEETGIPGLIHRYKIIMGGQEDKYFMLTSIKEMNFYNCGWKGVFVEMSDEEGDRNYEDQHSFRFIK